MRAGLCSLFALVALAAPVSAATPVEEFARPHQLVDIGGRKLNLFCSGSGPVTVLLEAGGSDWSAIWGLVQPALETTARVCSYDRAGLGYSDPAPFARTPKAIVDDMDALVNAAKLGGKLVLVGHSLGGFNAKLYTALHPDKVKALLLIDPSEERPEVRSHAFLVENYGRRMTAEIELSDQQGLLFLQSRYVACAEWSKAGILATDAAKYRRCTDPVRPKLGDAVARERARLQPLAAYQETQASEIRWSIYGDSGSDAAYRSLFQPGSFGKLPMIVLTHGDYDRSDPVERAGFETWRLLHQQSARLSLKGVQRTVPKSSHNIEIDQPQAIVEAVKSLAAAIR